MSESLVHPPRAFLGGAQSARCAPSKSNKLADSVHLSLPTAAQSVCFSPVPPPLFTRVPPSLAAGCCARPFFPPLCAPIISVCAYFLNSSLCCSERDLEVKLYRLREENGRLRNQVADLQREVLAVRSRQLELMLHATSNGCKSDDLNSNHRNNNNNGMSDDGNTNGMLLMQLQHELLQTREALICMLFSFLQCVVCLFSAWVGHTIDL